MLSPIKSTADHPELHGLCYSIGVEKVKVDVCHNHFLPSLPPLEGKLLQP
jgi:hypothetical protein